ncbi:MAG: VOC family protein [Dehalococcoidia bacterium]|nr:MAG: VOC family protein [Dehalococcoidia bacterium]
MLTNAPVHPTLIAVDVARAKAFYQDKLGLKLTKEDPSPGATFQAGEGTYIYIYQREKTKADHTVASFHVDDVEKTVKELQAKGIKFEDIDMPSLGIRTVNGIATLGDMKGAWFKDTEGNTLAISNT